MLCTDIIKSKISGSSSGGGGGISGGHTVTFKADGQTYAISSVKSGQSISAPSPNPTSESGSFVGWSDGSGNVTFPYTPSADIELTSVFASTFADQIYAKLGVDKTEYPYLLVYYTSSSSSRTYIYFGKNVSASSNIVQFGANDFYYVTPSGNKPSQSNISAESITAYIFSITSETFIKGILSSSEKIDVSASNRYIYANIDMPSGALTSNWHDMRIAE